MAHLCHQMIDSTQSALADILDYLKYRGVINGLTLQDQDDGHIPIIPIGQIPPIYCRWM
jgi:hypothetical protein